MSNKQTELLDEVETEKHVRIKRATLRKWRAEGKGPDYIKLGHRVYYRPSDLEKWINENVVSHDG